MKKGQLSGIKLSKFIVAFTQNIRVFFVNRRPIIDRFAMNQRELCFLTASSIAAIVFTRPSS